MWRYGWCCVLAAVSAWIALAAEGGRFTFVILGDRTGDTQPGVYEQVWREAAAERPAFAITVGDAIEGGKDGAAEEQWSEVESIWKSDRRFPLYLTPGNHDIWSAASEQLFRKHAGHAPRYSFDYEQAHFTVLDNSRSDQFSAEDLEFLENDLKTHRAAQVKMIFSHRPSWLLDVGLRNANAPLHRLAKQYGVQYVVAGHVHQMLRLELEGVTYISMASAGGHLRLSKLYQDGWFFGHARVGVNGREVDFQIEETRQPYGERHVTKARDWGMTGLVAPAK